MNQLVCEDTHCHISQEYFENPMDELKRLEALRILKSVALMGVNYQNNFEYLGYRTQLSSGFLKIGIGFHPSEVIELGNHVESELNRIKCQLKDNYKIIDFIGEIGIDFTYPDSRKYQEEQKNIFRQFLDLSVDYNLPVSIHCREAWSEVMECIDEVTRHKKKLLSGYLHCFTGDVKQGGFCIEHGLKLGVNGIITYKKSEALRNTFKSIRTHYQHKKLHDIFGLETDSPYLTPDPLKHSEKNSPANILIIKDAFESLFQ